jgi:hypothetical protein
VADLRPRVEELVGRLTAGRDREPRRPAGGTLADLRPGDAGFAETVARLVAMPLDRYAREGAPLEIQVPWLGQTLWFVPDERQAEATISEEVPRGRIWTAEELMRVVPVASRDVVQTIAIAKLTLDGDVTEVRRRETRLLAAVPRETTLAAEGPEYPPRRSRQS